AAGAAHPHLDLRQAADRSFPRLCRRRFPSRLDRARLALIAAWRRGNARRRLALGTQRVEGPHAHHPRQYPADGHRARAVLRDDAILARLSLGDAPGLRLHRPKRQQPDAHSIGGAFERAWPGPERLRHDLSGRPLARYPRHRRRRRALAAARAGGDRRRALRRALGLELALARADGAVARSRGACRRLRLKRHRAACSAHQQLALFLELVLVDLTAGEALFENVERRAAAAVTVIMHAAPAAYPEHAQ